MSHYMTGEQYRASEGISRSQLAILLNKTPYHFIHREDHDNDTPSLLFGRAAHKIILEPNKFDEEFVIAPEVDRRTKEGREIWNAFVEENEGADILTSEDYEKLVDMANAFRDNPLAYSLIKGGKMETSWFWQDADTGEVCKIRPDCLNVVDGVHYIIDYKTTDSCANGHFERSVKKYNYKLQAGMYREGMFHNTFENYVFVFIAQEKTYPYAVRVYQCTSEFCNEGYDQFRFALNLYHDCKVNNEWPGYDNTQLVEEGSE